MTLRARRTVLALTALAALAGCATASLSDLPSNEQEQWRACQPALARSCEHEVHENHFASVDTCLRTDEREYTQRPNAAERRAYVVAHGCTPPTSSGGAAAPATP